MKFSKELEGGTTATLILSVLNTGDAHGYEIARRINELSDGIIEWQEGTLSPALRQLEQQRLIEATRSEGSRGSAPCVYALTHEGRTALALEASAWSAYSKAVATVLEAAYA